MQKIKTPRGLSKGAVKIWQEITSCWDLDESTVIILEECCRCYSRLQQAREILDREGLTVTNSITGMIRKHPAAEIEKEARSGFLMGWRMLALDVEPPLDNGRPPGSARWA